MTETHMQPLDKRARLQELARLLGGSEGHAQHPGKRERVACGVNFFDFHRVIVNSKLPADRSRRFPSARRSIIIGILQMSHVLLGPKKESNHYAL
ncbi:DNA repair protein RecN [Klebsiella quasipneumoniae]|nr:DNA repair protein RecN [Klebsiella quasipneumoniae]